MRIVKLNYSRAPWRLLTSGDQEVAVPKGMDHRNLGATVFSESICGETQRECVESSLRALETLIPARAEIARLAAALSVALAQLEEERARLDWMNSVGAWIEWTMRDGSIRQCQVWTQNEDEEYIVLTGDRFFNDERAAIDAARSMTVITGDES